MKSVLICQNSHSTQLISWLEPIYGPRVTWAKRNPSLPEKESYILLKIYTSDISHSLLQCDQWPFTRVTWKEGGEVYAELSGIIGQLLWTDTIISRELKCDCQLPVRVEAYGDHVIMEFWPRSTSQWSTKPNLLLSPLFHNAKLVDILRNWQSPHIGF